MKSRAKKVLSFLIILLILGTSYYVWGNITGLYLPCMIYKTTGLVCPGCGVTRMIFAILQGDIKQAFHYNPALFILSPLLAIILIYQSVQYIRMGQIRISNKLNIFLIVIVLFLIIFGILRNIPSFYFLRP